MNETLTLDVSPRTVIGKKVKQLRKQGIVPGVVYGPKQESVPVQVSWTALRPVLIKAGGTHLIDLNLDGKTISVLIREVQRHPIRGEILNIDFYAADVNTRIRTTVPVVVPDMEAHMKRLSARILQVVNTVEIESLPGNIPEHIEIDLSGFSSAGNIRFKDIPAIDGVTHLADDDTVVVRIFIAGEEAEAEEEYTGEIGEVEVIGRGARDEEEFEEE